MATTVIWPFSFSIVLPILYRFSKVAGYFSSIMILLNGDTYSNIDECIGEENTCHLKLDNLNEKDI